MKNSQDNVEVSVIIVNFHTFFYTCSAVKSFIENARGFSYEIIIVDNSCDKEECRKLTQHFINNRKITVIDSGSNLGFGKGNNLGVKYSHGEFLYLLNEDTLMLNNACLPLLIALKKSATIGLVTSNLYSPDKKPTSSFDSKKQTIRRLKYRCSFANFIITRIFKRDSTSFNFSNKEKEIEGFAITASSLIRKSDFEEIGGFDKDIFLYSEDVLLCYMIMHKLGKKIISVPNSKVIHYEGAADNLKNTSLFKARAAMHSFFVYYNKLYGPKTAIKALKIERHYHSKAKFFYTLFRKKEHVKSQNNYLLAIDEEIKENENRI